MFDRRGFGSASLAEIARESGATPGSLYFYFPSKKELGLAIIVEQTTRALRVLDSARIDHGVLGVLVDSSRQLADLILTDPVMRAGMRLSLEQGWLAEPILVGYREWVANATRLFERADREGELQPGSDPMQLGRTVVACFTGVQMVSAVLSARADLYDELRGFWRVLIAAAAADERAESLQSLVLDSFAGPQPALVE